MTPGTITDARTFGGSETVHLKMEARRDRIIINAVAILLDRGPGRQAYPICPTCGNRRKILYMDSTRSFACRWCLGLPPSFRRKKAFEKIREIEHCLGPSLSRPKGMKQKRYRNLLNELGQLQRRQMASLETVAVELGVDRRPLPDHDRIWQRSRENVRSLPD